MLGKMKSWFVGLSKAGKIGVVLASLFVVGVAASPHKSPPSNPPAVQSAVQQKTEPKIEKKTVTETQAIAFEKTTVEDNSMNKGQMAVRTAGVNGVKTLTYEITLTDGRQTDKKLIKEEVTTQPVTEVTAVGTYVYVAPKPSCDPNYSGGCVPIASDVDCAGGSGNGPAYVTGPVTVIGSDIYGLDRDGDGVGCE